MSYAIICDARQGWKLGIQFLALVDRSKTRRLWWTSDDTSIIMNFRKKEAAEFSLKKLHVGSPKIVLYNEALNIIKEQDREITHQEADCEHVSQTNW